MKIEPLLRRHARTEATGRARRLAARVALLGAAAIAVLLLGLRLGWPVPLPWTPSLPEHALDRVFGWMAVSLAGLLQGLALLLLVVLAALAVRVVGPLLLRRPAVRVARALDRATGGDRFAAACEAAGLLAPVVRRRAAAQPPPRDTLAGRGPGAGTRWAFRLLAILALAVAVSPGTAPAGTGDAPVPGAPDRAREGAGIRLRLAGPDGALDPARPVTVAVLLEAEGAPATGVDWALALSVDGQTPRATGARLLLAAGTPGADRVETDLRPWLVGLPPGEHVAHAHAGPLTSNGYRFRIEDAGGGNTASPPPEPTPVPEPRPEREISDGGPRPDWAPEYVEPLRREGETVRKRARVPVESAGGAAPRERPLDEAWPELERRREAALDRPGLSPAARRLVREYYERLRPPAAEGER